MIQMETDRKSRTFHVNFQIPSNEPTIDEQFIVDNEYIAGGFVNVGDDLEKELFNDFADDIDPKALQRYRHQSSLHSNSTRVSVIRSPLELWQQLHLRVALHLDENEKQIVQEKPANSLIDVRKIQEKFQHKKIMCGVFLIRQMEIDLSERFLSANHYRTPEQYFIIFNIRSATSNQHSINPKFRSGKHQILESKENHRRKDKILLQLRIASTRTKPSQFLIYSMKSKDLQNLEYIEFECPFQCDLMMCLPIYRLIVAVMNITKQKSLLLLYGDASRKGIFLSKQEISSAVTSLLYVDRTAMLYLGCVGQVLVFNAQPFQLISQPIFLAELNELPFQSMEAVIHLCQIFEQNSIAILSYRYFLVYENSPKGRIRTKFCNPFADDFVRCDYNARYDLMIFALNNGTIYFYRLKTMEQLRCFNYHWKTISGLVQTDDQLYLISSSNDRNLNFWNLETLQHLYQYNADDEIFQLENLSDGFFFYRTSKKIVVFQFYLPTTVFSSTTNSVKMLKTFKDSKQKARLTALLTDESSLILSPISGARLVSVPNISKKPINQILYDISRSNFYALDNSGEIVRYRTEYTPASAQYRIQSKSKSKSITCMALINPQNTSFADQIKSLSSLDETLSLCLIFFGHADGSISLFQASTFFMKPFQAHFESLLRLETSCNSSEKSNSSLSTREILLSSTRINRIHLWDLHLDDSLQSISLVHLSTLDQEKNISTQSIRCLSMIDNFVVANYSDQLFVHLWQLIDISIRIDQAHQLGVIEHSSKGNSHHSSVQALTTSTRFILFATADSQGCIKLWDRTNTLLRDIYFDQTLSAIEFLSLTGDLLIAYQNNIHLISCQIYLGEKSNVNVQRNFIVDGIAEDPRLEVKQSVLIPYDLLPIFYYEANNHHEKKRLQRFECQLEGRFAIDDSDHSLSDIEVNEMKNSEHASIVSDESDWSPLNETIKDILRMKKISSKR